jgi:DNA-binding CsgD family transcriptional regulator
MYALAGTDIRAILDGAYDLLGLTGDTSPRRLSDFISARQFHRRPIYNLVYRSLGVETQLAFGLEPSRAGVVGFALSRGRADFSERDVAVLATLRPLLTQIRASLGHRPAAPESRLSLTRRQRDVMFLLSRGATNHQIALELGISEKTVAKHLEHVFRRLEVTNRTAAVAAWRAASDA